MPGSPSSDKENKSKPASSLSVGEVSKTYSKKAPVLKQKVLSTSNGSLSVQEEAAVNGVASTDQVKAEEQEVKGEEEEETKMEVVTEPPWGRCLATGAECPVHSTVLARVHWSYYSTSEQIDQLVQSLNTRGLREGELREKIIAERDFIESRLKKCREDQYDLSEEAAEELDQKQLQEVQNKRQKQSKHSGSEAVPMGTSLLDMIELSLRDQVLELEEKIFFGNLGILKVENRADWVAAITSGTYTMGSESLTWGEGDKLETDQVGEQLKVQQLAAAILQVGQMILDHDKYLKQPLGEDEKERKKRLKKEEDARKRKEEIEEDEEDDDPAEVVMTPFKKWEKSLMSSFTLGQLFIHLTTLDNSIVWSKSIMNTRCRICRKKTDPDQMLLCDSCDKGYHLYCLKPKLKSIPSGDWFCPECKPKERVRSPRKKVRKSFQINDLESGDDEEEPQSKKQKNSKHKKKVVESDEETTPPKRKGGGRRKIIEDDDEEEEVEEEESEDEAPKSRNKKGGLANLLGKRGAAKKAEKQMKGLDNSYREEEDEEEEEEKSRRKSRTRGNKSKEDNKENTRGKRGRNLEESVELNITGLELVLKGKITRKKSFSIFTMNIISSHQAQRRLALRPTHHQSRSPGLPSPRQTSHRSWHY